MIKRLEPMSRGALRAGARMMLRGLVAAMLLALGAIAVGLLAGCGGGGDDPPPDAETPKVVCTQGRCV